MCNTEEQECPLLTVFNANIKYGIEFPYQFNNGALEIYPPIINENNLQLVIIVKNDKIEKNIIDCQSYEDFLKVLRNINSNLICLINDLLELERCSKICKINIKVLKYDPSLFHKNIRSFKIPKREFSTYYKKNINI